jgi:hypothetical protein
MTTSNPRQTPIVGRLATTPEAGGFVVHDRPFIAANLVAEPIGHHADRVALPELRYGVCRPASTWLCRIDDIAATAGLLTCRRGAILDLLLRRTQFAPLGDDCCQHPVWINETFERTWLFVQLLLLLDQRTRPGGHHLLPVSLEQQVAQRLTATFRILDSFADWQVHAHSDLLRCMARDLVELFGSAIGDLGIRLDIERRRLPQLHWRALILAASHLIMRALLKGFRRRSDGTILVSLCAIAPHCIRLTITDDRSGAMARPDMDETSVLEDLTHLMDASLAWRSGTQSGSVAEITMRDLRRDCTGPRRRNYMRG